ncbi:N,N-dimethylformamidase beta subunit family domain-containing protein [Actinokineospora sp. HUAS TT18]|uniref:N,N-dimethylformamidase beta subunit family domain-containing protein n=1 Tax=Actinokineospora sp. HUAS TT18 TaxID=3447451 RepID=UPI003F51E290
MWDINQRFIRFVPAGNGALYAIQADGLLLWYRHSGWQTGAAAWSNGGGRLIGDGWQQFETVLGSADGQVFGITADGAVRWYKYQLSDPATGTGTWHPNSGATIHSGFAPFPRVFGGWGGVLYGVAADGSLHWWRYLAGDGTAAPGAWAANSGAQIGTGFLRHYELFADPNGVIYALRQGSSDLVWYRYLRTDGTAGPGAWANGGNGVLVGTGFSDSAQKTWFANTSGTVYTVFLDGATTPGLDHRLVWFRLMNSENIIGGANIAWFNGGSGLSVGEGFTVEPTAALQGYPTDLSPRAGGPQGFAVSSTYTSVEASIERLAVAGQSQATVWGPVSQPGRLQLLPGGYRSTGCAWTADFTLTIPPSWRSGVYVCRLRGLLNGVRHTRFDIPFVVRPAGTLSPIAVMLPTNTYSAYNTWGGHSQYATVGQAGVARVVASLRPSNSTWTTGRGRMNHTFFSDLLLLRWMVDRGFSFDCYQDGDLDHDPSWLAQYKVLVLGSHPEYWSQKMRDSLRDYLDGGGHVVVTGGNAIYERITWQPGGDSIVFRSSTGAHVLFAGLGQPASEVIGVDYDETTFMDFGPYEVVSSHPFLSGTGLGIGDTFGATAYNFTAAGWEVDNTRLGPRPGTTIIARGRDSQAEMIHQTKPNGGWVFSTGSMTFNGALATSGAASTILRNAIEAGLANPLV